MKRYHFQDQGGTNEKAGEPADRGGRVSRPLPEAVRSSGVYARGQRGDPRDGEPPPNEPPCTTFQEITNRYLRFVWVRAQRPWMDEEEAKDIFQKVFLDMLEYTRVHGVPKDVAPMLLTMIGHQICNYQRERIRRDKRFDPEADADAMPASKPGADQLIDLGGARQKVEAVVARMSRTSPDAATIFQLVDIDELSLDEVAATLGRQKKTVTVQISRARRAFWDLAGRLHNFDAGGIK